MIRGRNKLALYLNHMIFDEWTINNSWVLGLVTADGSVGSKSRPNEFKIYNTDLDLLEAARNVFEADKEVYVTKDTKGRLGKKPVGYLILSSPHIMSFFSRINVIGDKDLRNPFGFVPEEYKWSFIKGLFDGDGNVYKGMVSIAGRYPLISEVYTWICSQINKEPNKIYNSTGTSKTVYFQLSKKDAYLVYYKIKKHSHGTYDSYKFKKWESFYSH